MAKTKKQNLKTGLAEDESHSLALSNLKKRPTTEWETKLGFPELRIAGVDEVGRGCLAGPVVAAALILPAEIDYEKNPWLAEIADSKLVSPENRDRLAPLIKAWALDSAIGMASVSEIDEINIFHASHLAMERALSELRQTPDHVLIDGKFLPKNLPCPATALIKGDRLSLSIAGASILAKVYRDDLMGEYDALYPGYGFKAHKGYATPVHQRALVELRPCEIHRRSFAPVSLLLNATALTEPVR